MSNQKLKGSQGGHRSLPISPLIPRVRGNVRCTISIARASSTLPTRLTWSRDMWESIPIS